MDGGDFDSDFFFLMSSFKHLFISFVHGYACERTCTCVYRCLQRPKEGVGSTGTRKTDVCLMCMLGSRCLVLMIEQQALLTTKPSLQPPDECIPICCVVFGLLFYGRITLGCRTKKI